MVENISVNFYTNKKNTHLENKQLLMRIQNILKTFSTATTNEIFALSKIVPEIHHLLSPVLNSARHVEKIREYG